MGRRPVRLGSHHRRRQRRLDQIDSIDHRARAQIRLQVLNPDIPYQFFVMAPYVLAVLFLIVFAGRVRMPSALGVPFLGGNR